jgi:hypothetical protein
MRPNPRFEQKEKAPHPPTNHYEAHESNRIGEDSSAHGSAPNCQIVKKDKRRPGVARQGPRGPLWSNALHGGKRDRKSTFDVLEGRSPFGETLVAKKINKRIARREYTKDDVKELRAHSKARTPVVKLAKIMKRTERSLRQKATKLGIRLGHRR